jgi:uncharacterized protein (DUF433 family)
MTLKELKTQLAALSPREKTEVLQMLAHDLATWPGIEKTPGVAGGDACIVRTRIPVWTLVGYRRLGWSDARILENYLTLTASDLVNAWAYADAHDAEIERALEQNEEA